MISVVHTFKLYELVNKYFRNDDDSEAFIAEIDNFISAKPDVYHELATKSDLKKLEDATEKLEVAAEKFQAATKADLKRLETSAEKFQVDTKADLKRLETDIGEVKAEVIKLEIKMGEGFKDILKWIIALMLVFASLIITFIKILS